MKKNESILNLLAQAPWWVSVVASATVYFVLKFIIPAIEFENFIFKGFAGAAPQIAPVLSLVLLFPLPISLFNAWRKKKLLDEQEGIDTIRDFSWAQGVMARIELFQERLGFSR